MNYINSPNMTCYKSFQEIIFVSNLFRNTKVEKLNENEIEIKYKE